MNATTRIECTLSANTISCRLIRLAREKKYNNIITIDAYCSCFPITGPRRMLSHLLDISHTLTLKSHLKTANNDDNIVKLCTSRGSFTFARRIILLLILHKLFIRKSLRYSARRVFPYVLILQR